MAQLGEDRGPGTQRARDLLKGDLAIDRMEEAAEPLERLANSNIGGWPAEKGVCGATRGAAPIVQVEVRLLEGDALVIAVGMVIEDPLGHRPNGREAGGPVGEDVPLVAAGLPVAHSPARLGPPPAHPSAEVAGDRAQPALDLEAAEERAELVVRVAEQIAADVFQKVQVAREHWDVAPQLDDEILAGLRHRAAEVAHDGAGRAEAADDPAQPGGGDLGALGGGLPGAPHPPGAP